MFEWTWIDKNQRCCSPANVPKHKTQSVHVTVHHHLPWPYQRVLWLQRRECFQELPGTLKMSVVAITKWCKQQDWLWEFAWDSLAFTTQRHTYMTNGCGVRYEEWLNIVNDHVTYCFLQLLGRNDKILLAIIDTIFIKPSVPEASYRVLYQRVESLFQLRLKSPSSLSLPSQTCHPNSTSSNVENLQLPSWHSFSSWQPWTLLRLGRKRSRVSSWVTERCFLGWYPSSLATYF